MSRVLARHIYMYFQMYIAHIQWAFVCTVYWRPEDCWPPCFKMNGGWQEPYCLILICGRINQHSKRIHRNFLIVQALASASGSFGISPSQICIWDLQQQVCKKVLSHHEHNVVCLDFSRDDRFLISVGKFSWILHYF